LGTSIGIWPVAMRRHVVGGEHGVNAGHGARRRALDLVEASMGMRAPHERCVQHAR